MRKLRAFDLFTAALREFESEDKILYSWPRNRVALAHALALHLYTCLSDSENNFFVDMVPSIKLAKRSVYPDIAIHNRKGQTALAVICRNDYLSDADQKNLTDISAKCDLAMAVSFFPQKSYMLLYRATPSGIEYFHFDRNTLTVEAVRKKALPKKKEDSEQSYLSL